MRALLLACVSACITQSAVGGIIALTERTSLVGFLNQANCLNAFPASTNDFLKFDVTRSGTCSGTTGSGQSYNGDFVAAQFSDKSSKSEINVNMTSTLNLDVVGSTHFAESSGDPLFRIFNSSRFSFTVDQDSAGQIEFNAAPGLGSQPTATLEADGQVIYDSELAQNIERIFFTPGVIYRWAVDGDLTGGISPFLQGSTVTTRLKIEEDADGWADFEDNCTLLDNSLQRDTDGDGIGNRCDADINNDCIVNLADLVLFRNRFSTSDPDADFNGDMIVNLADLIILKDAFSAPPGPSGVDNICD